MLIGQPHQKSNGLRLFELGIRPVFKGDDQGFDDAGTARGGHLLDFAWSTLLGEVRDRAEPKGPEQRLVIDSSSEWEA
jgi:hypothetical protein